MIFLRASGGSAHDESSAHLEAGLGMVQHAAQAEGQGQRLQLLLKCALVRSTCKVITVKPFALNWFSSLKIGSGSDPYF